MPKRHSRSERAAILRRFEESGLTIREFCSRNGLSPSSLQRWRAQAASNPRKDFVELVGPDTEDRPTSTAWKLDVTLPDGIRLQFRG